MRLQVRWSQSHELGIIMYEENDLHSENMSSD
jgi:hypothetical protein